MQKFLYFFLGLYCCCVYAGDGEDKVIYPTTDKNERITKEVVNVIDFKEEDNVNKTFACIQSGYRNLLGKPLGGYEAKPQDNEYLSQKTIQFMKDKTPFTYLTLRFFFSGMPTEFKDRIKDAIKCFPGNMGFDKGYKSYEKNILEKCALFVKEKMKLQSLVWHSATNIDEEWCKRHLLSNEDKQKLKETPLKENEAETTVKEFCMHGSTKEETVETKWRGLFKGHALSYDIINNSYIDADRKYVRNFIKTLTFREKLITFIEYMGVDSHNHLKANEYTEDCKTSKSFLDNFFSLMKEKIKNPEKINEVVFKSDDTNSCDNTSASTEISDSSESITDAQIDTMSRLNFNIHLWNHE